MSAPGSDLPFEAMMPKTGSDVEDAQALESLTKGIFGDRMGVVTVNVLLRVAARLRERAKKEAT